MVAWVGFSVSSLFAGLLGLLAGAASLATERSRGVLERLLATSLSRIECVIGTWLGIFAVSSAAVLLLGGIHIGATLLRGGPPAARLPDLLLGLCGPLLYGGVAAAGGVAFSAALKPAAAFGAALLVLIGGHLAPVHLPVLAPLFPRSGALSLGETAAFGALGMNVTALATVHALSWSLAVLLLATTWLSLVDGKT